MTIGGVIGILPMHRFLELYEKAFAFLSIITPASGRRMGNAGAGLKKVKVNYANTRKG
jgi:hypothetical protein